MDEEERKQMREMIRSAATAPLAKNEDKHDGNHQDDPEYDTSRESRN